MISPSRRLVVALALSAIPFLLEVWMPGLARVGGIATALLLLAVLIDGATTPTTASFTISLRPPSALGLGREESIGVEIRNGSRRRQEGWIRVQVPETWTVPALLQPLDLEPLRIGETVYRATPGKRGKQELGPVFIRLLSPLGLLWRDLRVDARVQAKIYPALGSVRQVDFLSRRLRLRDLGLRVQRQRGQGMEFERLRDHHPDDGLRRIDWKATARRGRFITREYQIERCQNVVLMIDAGRMMTEEVDGIVKIEYVLRAALLLARIAAQFDDRVGALVFSERVERLTPLRKGHGAVRALADALYEIEPQLCEANYEAAFGALNSQYRKRALVVLFTNLVDQGTSGLVAGYLKAVRARHVPLCVAVGDRETRETAWRSPGTVDEAYRKAAAAQLLIGRARTVHELQRSGVQVIDAPAGEISVQLMNKYLDLKARQVL
ncbi:MAG TPA: DUF58 domain-containing protein [Planctomycetota bacterium]|nr:DUF58 domain-containing protein [Planctomycetota bacterium]